MNQKISEKDLEQIFIASRFKKKSQLKVFFGFLIVFLLFFALISYLLNFSAFNQKIAWWYQDEFQNNQPQQLTLAVKEYQASSGAPTQKAGFPEIPDNSIFIESINIKSPVSFGVENDENAISSNLKAGVIQLIGTSLPGEMGNVFITGHSSNYPWVRSNYNAIFALLPNVVVGDLIQLKFHNTNYIYRVKKVFTVSPDDTSVMKSDNSSSILTLMTCTPVGTSLRRLIVVSDQIIPNPSANTKSGASGQATMPAGVR